MDLELFVFVGGGGCAPLSAVDAVDAVGGGFKPASRRAGSADAFGPATPLFYIYGHGYIHCIMNPLFLTTVIIINLVLICI